MNRTVWLDVYGTAYPMLCSLGAIDRLYEQYGGAHEFAQALTDDGKMFTATMDAVELFIAQGCAHENRFHATMPGFPDGGYKPIGKEDLMCAFTLSDFPELLDKVRRCIALSKETSIEGKSKKKASREATT